MLPRAGRPGYRAVVTTDLDNAGGRTTALLDLLDLTPGDAPDTFVGHNVTHTGPRVFGGQVLAQAVVAAGRTVPEGRRPHSLHAYFLRPGDLGSSIVFAVERLRDGRSFSARRVQAMQADGAILSMIASFESPAEGLEHADSMPAAPDPTTLPSLADLYGGADHASARYWVDEQPLDLRFVTPSIFVEAVDPPAAEAVAWWRTAGAIATDDALMHAAVAAYASDYGILEPVLRAHGRAWLSSGLSISSVDHAMWFHRPFRADEWMLSTMRSPSASASRGLNLGSMFTVDGSLAISVAQEGLFRPRDPAFSRG